MVKSIAEKHGLRATFMPKPFPTLTRSGRHAHISVRDKEGKTSVLHAEADEIGLSAQGYHFLGESNGSASHFTSWEQENTLDV
jgi:glutamine synthetase